MYLLPDDVLDYTRHTHNETVWERRNISGDTMFKKQPSYIVYFVDNFEDRLSDPEAMKQWESVQKAASNFAVEVDGVKRPLPIMVVEREKIAKSQLEIVQNKLNEFKTTLDSRLIKDIISGYESNYAGNREYHLNISEKYFPKHDKLSDSVVGEIIETIKKIYTIEPNVAVECIYELEKVVRNEQEKYNNTQHGVGQSLPSFNIEEALIEINKLKSNFKMSMDSTLVMINNIDGNDKQYERSDFPIIEQSIAATQLSSSDVMKMLKDSGLSSSFVMLENEIEEENVNAKLKVHGQRHIKNVLLYSALIGQSIVRDKHDLDLLMLSAKYHDIGRMTDAHEEHAMASAKIAIEKLKDICSPEDLSVISTIIEFHEIPRNIANVDELFIEIARRNGVADDQISRVRQMAEVLKDADALDRTRFINKARVNPEYLQFDFSKQLIKFASSLQETYAINDLKEFRCDESIDVLLQTHTPQEVLRTIRHSTKGYLRYEDIHDFIKSWARSSMKKNDELEIMLSENDIAKEESINYGK
jgi:HD-GYP domain-containing protein (c-di-GMP phosphodiesterase class II)